jgi:protein-disulfide isomerase
VLGSEPQIKEKYVKTGQVKLVFNPILDHGDGSLQAHQAAECAGEQGMFWPMHDILFEQQGSLYGGDVREVIKGMAGQLPLDRDQFNTCLDEQRTAALVQSQDQRRHQLGIRTRPTFDLNGQLIVGAQPFEVLQNAIESLLGQE